MSDLIPAQSSVISPRALSLPDPATPMSVRVGTRDDIAFMDRLQKLHSKALGFFPRAQMEGYIEAGNVLVALDAATGEKIGYVASKDRYLKRDELGAVFQLCVAPGRERGFIGANLLREVFERSSYGCRLYCCWCAQDLPANKFWEAMGFVPIAYRAGSANRGKKQSPRVHIFWQKRIRSGDVTTPYWFPAKTEGGAIREDRIILPIPPGMRWTDALPVLCPRDEEPRKRRPAKTKPAPGATLAPLVPTHRPKSGIQFGRIGEKARTALEGTQEIRVVSDLPAVIETKPRKKTRCDPALIAKARELRDRWMEQVNAQGLALPTGKYDVARGESLSQVGQIEMKSLAA